MNKTISYWSIAVRILIAVCFLQQAACNNGNKASSGYDPSTTATAMVTGTVSYRERIALPPGATLDVQLLDTSLADVPSVRLGSYHVEVTMGPPFNFSIEYAPADIDQSFSYSVRAEIRKDGKLLFTTDTNYPVLTRGAGASVDIVLIKVGGSPRNTPLE